MRKENILWIIAVLLSAFAGLASAFAGGTGTLENPYRINNCTALNDTRDYLSSNFTLTQEIDCTDTKNWAGGAGFLQIGSVGNPFIGNFDGAGFNITNLSITRTERCGLFMYLSGNISNLGLINVKISCSSSEVGSFAGILQLSGKISNSYATGTVSGTSNVGGLVGHGEGTIFSSYTAVNVSGTSIRLGGLVGDFYGKIILNSYATGSVYGSNNRVGGLVGEQGLGDIQGSYSTGTVSGIGHVGGLVGIKTAGNIDNSYATGNISGSGEVGGLVGRQVLGDIINSYSIGIISNTSGVGDGLLGIKIGGSCTGNFWDNETSNQTASACGTGKTTADMKTRSTFTDAVWDFAGNWSMGQAGNNGYPFLRWQRFNPAYATFSSSSNFNSVPDVNNVTNAVLANNVGSIKWNNGINVNGADFDSYAAIGSGFVSINASKFDSSINTSVNVTFQTQSCNGLQLYHAGGYFTTLGDIITNGQLCEAPLCTNIICTQGANSATVTATVQHLDGLGGSSGAVPEFSAITTMIALAVVLAGFLVMRKRTQ